MPSQSQYAIMPLFSKEQPSVIVGYAAIRPHDRGFYYLAVTATRDIVERASYGTTPVDGGYTFPTPADARDAIETWQHQNP